MANSIHFLDEDLALLSARLAFAEEFRNYLVSAGYLSGSKIGGSQ